MLENRSNLRRLISEFSSLKSGSVCELSFSAEATGFETDPSEDEESAAVEGPGCEVGDTPAVNFVCVVAASRTVPNPEGPAPTVIDPEGPVPSVPNPEGPASVVPDPDGPAPTVPDPEGPGEVDA